jgi:hypothetical protein
VTRLLRHPARLLVRGFAATLLIGGALLPHYRRALGIPRVLVVMGEEAKLIEIHQKLQ